MISTDDLIKKTIALNADKKNESVIVLLPQALLEERESADSYFEKAMASYQIKNCDQIETMAQVAIHEVEKKAKTDTFLKANYYEKNEFEKAKKYYEKAVKIDSKYDHGHKPAVHISRLPFK
jgi:tetratricopeptide (TPR) repeat protein